MSSKQELLTQIEKIKNVLANPKTDGSTKKILESSLKKAEDKLGELEKAEKLEKSKQELTTKEEKKVEETKQESKDLISALKKKVETAKKNIKKTTVKAKQTSKTGSRSVSKAKKIAKEKRSSQNLSTSAADIERDAERPALPRGKRTAKKSGKTYYEYRDNRIDRQSKRYARLEDGGMMARGGEIGERVSVSDYTNFEYFNTLEQAKNRADILRSMGYEAVVTKSNSGYEAQHRVLYKKNIKDSRDEMRVYADGGMFGSKRNLSRDRMFKSQEDWEQSYKRKSSPKNKRYGYEVGGLINAVGGGTYSGVDLSGLSNIDVSAGYFAKGGGVDDELKEALKIAQGSIFSQDFLDKYEIVKERFNTKKDKNAEELAKERESQLKKQGYAVKVKKVSFEDLARSTGYFITAVRRKMTKEDAEFERGGGVGNKNFENGEIVWDDDNKRYGVVLNNYGGIDSEVRLDSDGNQPIENLHKLGTKGDKGTKEQLQQALFSHKRLVDEYNYDRVAYAKGGKVSDKYKYIPNRMIQSVEVERNGKETEIDGANVLDGIYVKKGVRFDRGGMNEMANQYIVYFKSNNPIYKEDDGFEGNPPAIYYADNTYEVMDYLKENLPSDVELVSIEEMQPVEMYEKGGHSMNKSGEMHRTEAYAKGGMTEHGLKRGDEVVDDMFWENSITVRNRKDGTMAQVNLDNGIRKEAKM